MRPRLHRRYRDKLRVRTAEFLAALTSRLLWISLFSVLGIVATGVFSFLQLRLMDIQTELLSEQKKISDTQTGIQRQQSELAESQQWLAMGATIKELLDSDKTGEDEIFAPNGIKAEGLWSRGDSVDTVSIRRIDTAGAALLNRQLSKNTRLRDAVGFYLDSESPFIALSAAIALAGTGNQCDLALKDRTIAAFSLGETKQRTIDGICLKNVDFENARIANVEFGQAAIDGLSIRFSKYESLRFTDSTISDFNISVSSGNGLYFDNVALDGFVMDQSFRRAPRWLALTMNKVTSQKGAMHINGCVGAKMMIDASSISALRIENCWMTTSRFADSKISMYVVDSVLQNVNWQGIQGDIEIEDSVLALNAPMPAAAANETIFIIERQSPLTPVPDAVRQMLGAVCRRGKVRVFDLRSAVELKQLIENNEAAWLNGPVRQASKVLTGIATEIPQTVVESLMRACP